MEGKLVSASRITLAQLLQPQHANTHGNVHGGWIMKLVDEAGGLVCMRHSQQRVVTVALDQMVFKQPILIGNLVTLVAEVSYTGRTSMEVEVRVTAEDPLSGKITDTNSAYLVYVALDENGVPTPVPPIIPETERQKKRLLHAKDRQENRIKYAARERQSNLDS